MADQQGNFLSKFVPRSHFFTDPDTITQTETQAFGPASTEEFRVTSSFNIAAANANAYAICKGIALVQPQAGSTDKVNLVLRPYTQPIQGLNIKYFIYRGLKLSDFFSGTLVKIAGANSSDLVNSINSSFTAFHTSIGDGAVPDFLAKYIGFDPANQAETLPLSDFFFKQSDYVESNGEFEESGDTAFELPAIAMGATLGTFAAGECGIDVVLNYGDYKLPLPNDEFNFNLAYARAAKATISTSSESDPFKKKVIREQIFQFLDVAAYFGFHAIDTGSVTLNSSGTKQIKKGQEIYDLMVSKFFTRNRLYLYIQSDRTRSYNFYENYTIAADNDNCLKMGTSETALTERKYETSGWPLIIDESIQSHDENLNTLYLQLVTDNNVNTMLYGQVAQIANAQSNNFCGRDDLKLSEDADYSQNGFTKSILFSSPGVKVSGAVRNICSFNIILFQGAVYRYQSVGTAVSAALLQQPVFLDDIIGHIDAIPLLKADNDFSYSSMNSQRLKLLSYYNNDNQFGISANQTTSINDVIETGDTGSPELKRVTYLLEPIDVLNNPISVSGGISSNSQSTSSVAGSVTGNKTYEQPAPYYYDLEQFTDGLQIVNGLLLKSNDNALPNKVILGLTKVENDSLIAALSTGHFTNACLVLSNLFDAGSDLISVENIVFQKFKIGIAAENFSGEIELIFPESEVFAYALDRHCYFSKGYSEYVKQASSTSLFMDLDIII